MRQSKSVRLLLAFLFWLLSSFYYIIILNGSETIYGFQGGFLVSCNFVMYIFLLIILNKREFYIFEPITFVFFLYYMIFIFEPIRNISINNVTEFGVNTMGGCIKATCVFIIGFSFMLIGYYLDDHSISYHTSELELKEEYDISSLLRFSWLIWFVGIASFLLYNISIGRSAIYMLSFGRIGSASLNGRGFNILIISVVIYISFYPLMCILIYEQSKILRLIALVITCIPLATRGFRNILVVVLSAPVIFYYIKRRKTPTLKASVALFAIFIFIFGFIGSTRGATRTGAEINLDSYHYSKGLDGMLYYFDSYKVFYGAVEQYPRYYSYTFGKQLLYTFIMFIPRFVWSGKPEPLIREVIGRSTGPLSASSGSAWPNIGEYYTDFGIIGSILCMFILGCLLRKMKNLYQKENASVGSISLYCLFLPALVTIIAYGYTAGNAPQYLLMALPYLLGKNIVKKASEAG